MSGGGGVRTCVHFCSGVEGPILGVLSMRSVHMYQCWHGIGTNCQKAMGTESMGFRSEYFRPALTLAAPVACPQLSCISIIQCTEGRSEAYVLWSPGAPLIFLSQSFAVQTEEDSFFCI
jgi:hypothetical protein